MAINAYPGRLWKPWRKGEEMDKRHLDLNVVVEDGEDLDKVAKEMIGPKGLATYEVLGYVAGDQWPTIRFFGTMNQLAAIEAKSEGRPVGRPRKK